MNFGKLMVSKFFAPIFWTQFLGAFNDNVYKNALIILITFQAAHYTQISAQLLIPISMGLFILPFFLFSALAGQLADKYEKSKLIRSIKLLEVNIMLLATLGFYLESLWFLIGILFLMGCQSALFGPVKYSILPQHLNEENLLKANGFFGMGTFMAILLGTITGGILVIINDNGIYIISFIVVGVALLGWLSSQKIPLALSANQNLKINWNIFVESRDILSLIKKNRLLLGTVLSISWFWFLGATILTIIPGYTKDILHGNEQVVTLLLAIFSIGIGTGAIIVGKSKTLKKSIKWIGIGTLGISLSAAHLYWNSVQLENQTLVLNLLLNGLLDWHLMFDNPLKFQILLDVLFLGMSGGFYIVPLYVILQQCSDIKTRSRTIAANNILNAFFMVCSAIATLLLLDNGVAIYSIFFLLAISNLLIVGLLLYIFRIARAVEISSPIIR